MRDPSRSDDVVTLNLAAGELRTLCSGMNEALEALDDWEFPIRMGVSIDEARALMARLRATLDDLERHA